MLYTDAVQLACNYFVRVCVNLLAIGKLPRFGITVRSRSFFVRGGTGVIISGSHRLLLRKQMRDSIGIPQRAGSGEGGVLRYLRGCVCVCEFSHACKPSILFAEEPNGWVSLPPGNIINVCSTRQFLYSKKKTSLEDHQERGMPHDGLVKTERHRTHQLLQG